MTENFPGAYIEGLVRFANIRAHAKLTIEVTEFTLSVVVHPELLKTVVYCRSDFIHALETMNKPVKSFLL